MKTWGFLNTGAATASFNMALDQAILARHAAGKCLPTLRIYRWDPPAISLGYFQRRHEIDLEACERLGIDVIRRPTGGRAVLHSRDLTYSLIAGTDDGIPATVTEAYHLISEGLVMAFQDLGIEVEIRNPRAKSVRSDICFLTSTSGDILCKGRKLAGSAQTWSGSSMLQHGSIILEPNWEIWSKVQKADQTHSPAYQEKYCQSMTSVRDILGQVPETDRITSCIQKGIAQVLGIEFAEINLAPEELSLASKIANQNTSAKQNAWGPGTKPLTGTRFALLDNLKPVS